MTRATLIYNPTAGRHTKKRENQVREAADILRSRGVTVKLARTCRPGHGTDLAREAVGQGDDLILACGGDGTINAVVNGMTPGNTVLGILPGGTANVAAKELGLPHHPVRAAQALSGWKPRRIALGLATWSEMKGESASNCNTGRRYFLTLAGVGFDAHILRHLQMRWKMSLGVGAYVLEALRQVVLYRFPTFDCELQGEMVHATFAAIQRGSRYAGWLHLTPQASLFEPRLTLCLFPSQRWSRYLLYASAVLIRRHDRLRDVKLFHACEIRCTVGNSGNPVYFELDGELIGRLPVVFEVVPDALTVLAP